MVARAAVGDAGGGEQHRARADRADDRAARMGRRDPRGQLAALRLAQAPVPAARVPAAARDDDHVRGARTAPRSTMMRAPCDAVIVAGAVGADQLGVDVGAP